jgi:hypothetical protein
MAFVLNHKMAKILGMIVEDIPMSTTARMPRKWYIGWCSAASLLMMVRIRLLAMHSQGQGEPVGPSANAWESHQNELRDLELRAVGISEKLEHPSLRGKCLCYHS